MAIPVTHTLRLFKIDTEDPLAAPFVVRCSCQWEGRAHTRQVADRWMSSHAWAQNQRGNEVIIEIDPALQPKPEPEPDKPSKVDVVEKVDGETSAS